MAFLNFPQSRTYDAICLGRLAVDLYAQQYGCSLEDANSFSKYLGGSSANIAFGLARLKMKSAMLSRVGDEQNGRFLLKTLEQEGCDTSQIQIDRERLTGMVLLGIKDQHTFPLLFARENCADMALDSTLINEEFISQCRSLVITGTHLSTPTVLAASHRALELAQLHQLVRVLDIDYRPVLWGLTGKGNGQDRYIANDSVSQHLQKQLPHFELIIGTEEEWMIAGGVANDLLASLRHARKLTAAVMVVKRGATGCTIIEGQIPAQLDDALTILGERIEVLNVLGAGDAFAAGLLAGLLQGKDFKDSARLANACGAIVVSRHGCAPAMPTLAELDYWFAGNRSLRPDTDPQLAHLHRVTVNRPAWPELCVLAYDHRSQFEELANQASTDPARITALKLLLNKVVADFASRDDNQGKIGVLIDSSRGEKALHDATGRGWWVGRPIEMPGSRPLRFESSSSLASSLTHWPREQIVKCLVFYHPNDPKALRDEQDRTLLEVWEATRESGHELLLEVIPPKDMLAADDEGEAVLETIRHFYSLGFKPEWWKLGMMSRANWQVLDKLIRQQDPYCRGAVILGLNQPVEQLIKGFADAQVSVVKGFMVGRSVWSAPAFAWLSESISDEEFCQQVSTNFESLIRGWKECARAERQIEAFIDQ
jgi:5-dehydro-2-deoxygluconokinase